ncbi:S41 family peptidase [Chryseobacterium sp. ON_d1]|uniref:S41 family peptidase n=1 Tax=Chryseobacterium sp. ON_d1 TaxID=2583211 RepID=UPI001156D14A|nr:S41 family peptidase [Chryseobacterium sp. ON_d1]
MKFILIGVFLFLSNRVLSQTTPKLYIEKAISIMEMNSVNKNKIDWKKIKENALEEGKDKNSIRETYPIIRNILGKLGDQHSKFFKPEVVEAYLKRYKEVGIAFPYPKDSLIGADIAYVTVPAIAILNNEDWNEYVESFYAKIKKLDHKNPKCWVIDLRENDGGMFAPMFKAVYPFLGRKNVVGSMDNTGEIKYFNYKDSNIYFGSYIIGAIATPDIELKNKNIPIFVLTSKKTASSGEFLAASFKGQKNVKIIGTNTQGLTSDNSEFKLEDGAFLVLTTGILIDRNKREYRRVGEGISPDYPLEEFDFQNYIDEVKRILIAVN